VDAGGGGGETARAAWRRQHDEFARDFSVARTGSGERRKHPSGDLPEARVLRRRVGTSFLLPPECLQVDLTHLQVDLTHVPGYSGRQDVGVLPASRDVLRPRTSGR
jgi:hypothetical protein